MPTQLYYRDSDETEQTPVNSLHPLPVKDVGGAALDQNVGVLKVEERFQLLNISTQTTTLVKASAGFLHCITVNTTAAGAVTVYDSTLGSGTKIATLKSSIVENTYFFDGEFKIGLTIVTAAATDLTVSYR